MANIENIKVGNTTYGLRDGTALQNLTAAQETTILSDGTYKGEDVVNGTVFTTADGKFKEFGKEASSDLLVVNDTIAEWKYFLTSSSKYFWFGGNSTTYGYSTNGVDWSTGSTSNSSSGDFRFVIKYGTNILGYGEYRCAKLVKSTDDGATWEVISSGLYNDDVGSGVRLSNGTFIAWEKVNGNTCFYYSSDGVNWTDAAATVPDTTGGRLILADEDYVYCIASTTGTVSRTQDGTTWETVGTSDFVPNAYGLPDRAYYYKGKFWTHVYGDYYSIFSTLKYSTDCLHWTSVGNISNNYNNNLKRAAELVYCGTASEGIFLIYPYKISTETKYYYQSDDGITWEEKETTQNFRYSKLPVKGTDFLLTSDINQYYIGSSEATYTYSLTPLSYDKDEVDALISGGGSVALTDIASAGSNITFTTLNVIDNIASSDKIGSPTITTEGLFTPTDSSYLLITSASVGSSVGTIFSGNYDWVLTIKFKTPESYTKDAHLWVFSGGYNSGVNAVGFVNNNGKIALNYKIYDWGNYEGATTLDTDTDYYARYTHDSVNNKYTVEISKNGSDWTTEIDENGSGGFYGGSSQDLYISTIDSNHIPLQFDLNGLRLTSSYNSTNWKAYTYDPNGKTAVSVDVKQASGAPSTSTAGAVGQLYVDTSNSDGYMCVAASGGTYTWKKITP